MLKLSQDSHRPSLTFSIQKVYKIHRVVMLQPQCDYCEIFWKVVLYVNRGYLDIILCLFMTLQLLRLVDLLYFCSKSEDDVEKDCKK